MIIRPTMEELKILRWIMKEVEAINKVNRLHVKFENAKFFKIAKLSVDEGDNLMLKYVALTDLLAILEKEPAIRDYQSIETYSASTEKHIKDLQNRYGLTAEFEAKAKFVCELSMMTLLDRIKCLCQIYEAACIDLNKHRTSLFSMCVESGEIV